MKEIYFQEEINSQRIKEEIHQDDEQFFESSKMILQNALRKKELLSSIWEIKLDASNQVLKALEEIFENMQDKILNWEYWLIIWDDASARMPANIVQKTINNIYNKLWHNPIKIGYIKWRVCNSEVRIKDKNWLEKNISTEEYLNSYLKKLNIDQKKILIVTEAVLSWWWLWSRVTKVENNDMDLIALDFQDDDSIDYPEIRVKELEKISNIYSPKKNFEHKDRFDYDCLHTRQSLSHVEKDMFENTIHARRVTLSENQKQTYVQSKKEIKIIAKYLSEIFWRY